LRSNPSSLRGTGSAIGRGQQPVIFAHTGPVLGFSLFAAALPRTRIMNANLSSPQTLECVALLGRRDEPTDAVETYCEFLASALAAHSIRVRAVRLHWAERGWEPALASLRSQLDGRPPHFAILQYTALAWSRRGFPFRFLRVLRLLRRRNIACAVVFHDAGPYGGTRIADRLRRLAQRFVMRAAARRADLTILTVPADRTQWLPSGVTRCVTIPVGANLPEPEAAWIRRSDTSPPTVAVFSVTGEASGEVRCITAAVRYASERIGELRLLVFGRNAGAFDALFRQELAGVKVQLTVQGLTDEAEIVRFLRDSSVLLFVRGHISSRRSSAIAGIACGLPVIARQGWETGPPITEAGVVLLKPDADGKAFGVALARILTEKNHAAELAERSRQAYTRYFSWPAIAAKYADALHAAGAARRPSAQGKARGFS
jgi:glycosyltransferase involved in cell wall biosynthesis